MENRGAMSPSANLRMRMTLIKVNSGAMFTKLWQTLADHQRPATRWMIHNLRLHSEYAFDLSPPNRLPIQATSNVDLNHFTVESIVDCR